MRTSNFFTPRRVAWLAAAGLLALALGIAVGAGLDSLSGPAATSAPAEAQR